MSDSVALIHPIDGNPYCQWIAILPSAYTCKATMFPQIGIPIGILLPILHAPSGAALNIYITYNHFLFLDFLCLLPTLAGVTGTGLPSTSVLSSPSSGHFNTLPACNWTWSIVFHKLLQGVHIAFNIRTYVSGFAYVNYSHCRRALLPCLNARLLKI